MDPATLLRKVVRIYPDNLAVRFGDRALTYTELAERSNRLANGLRDLGAQKGDRIALLGDNSLNSIEQILGTAIGGYVRCSLTALDPAARQRYLVELTEAKILIVQDK